MDRFQPGPVERGGGLVWRLLLLARRGEVGVVGARVRVWGEEGGRGDEAVAVSEAGGEGEWGGGDEAAGEEEEDEGGGEGLVLAGERWDEHYGDWEFFFLCLVFVWPAAAARSGERGSRKSRE